MLQTQNSVLHEKLVQFIYVPIIVWIILVLIYLFFLTLKYTFGKWTVENPNPYIKETMALPRGVMRGLLTLSILFTALLLEIFAIENPTFESNIGQFIVAFQMMLAFYFGSQIMHHLTSVEKSKALHIADTFAKVEETKAGAKVVAAAATNGTVEEIITSGQPDFEDEEAEG